MAICQPSPICLGPLGLHARVGELDGADDAGIAGAAAEIAGEACANLRLVRATPRRIMSRTVISIPGVQ